MKHIVFLIMLTLCALSGFAQTNSTVIDNTEKTVMQTDLLQDDDSKTGADAPITEHDGEASDSGFYQILKTKFIEGTPAFMSLVAIVLIIGLTLCIERLIHLTTLQTDTAAFIVKVRQCIIEGKTEEAERLCREERHPVAALAQTALHHPEEKGAALERLLAAEGSKQATLLEKGCSWIALCIRLAPSLGFLGTVIGMVMAFDRIEEAGDISPTLVAGGMKVALITTIFGIITALILQVFYNLILNKIQKTVGDMEQAGTTLVQQSETP